VRFRSIRVKIDIAVLLVLILLAAASGVLMYTRMGQGMEAESHAAVKRENSMAYEYLDVVIPGNWYTNKGSIAKGVATTADMSDLVDQMGIMLDAKISIFAGEEPVVTNVLQADGKRALGVKAASEVLDLVLRKGGDYDGPAMVLGEPYQAFYRPILDHLDQPIGMFFIGVPRSTIGKATAVATLQFVLLFVFVAALSLFVMFRVTTRLLGPVGLVAAKLEAIAGGAGDLTLELPVSTRDEVGILSGSFNSVMAKLRDMIDALKTVSSTGSLTSETLASHSHELSATMTEVAATMRSVDEKNRMLHDGIMEAELSLSHVDGSVLNLAGLVEEQSAAVGQSSALVRQTSIAIEAIARSTDEKRAQTEGLALSAGEGEEAMGEMVAAIADISSRARSISDLLELLKGIAEQTSLLGMNAAIEAAHAGEAGKGFAVVAEEIRRLAEATSANSTVASANISGIVESIGAASGLSSKAGELIGGIIRGATEVSASMNGTLSAMREAVEGFRQHSAALERLQAISSESLEASRVAGKGAAAIRTSFAALRSLADENRAGISEIAIGLNEIAEAAATLAGLGTENSRSMDTLEEEIGKFKTESAEN
jgi:methyl-accepting chemotaxis protein